MISVPPIPEKTGRCSPVYTADIVSDTFKNNVPIEAGDDETE